jgi:SAM-dependent methyltransferase
MPPMTTRKDSIRAYFDGIADQIDSWRRRNRYYHQDHVRYHRYLVGTGKRVLELGSGTGELLNALEPSTGVGVELSPETAKRSQQRFPQLRIRTEDAESLGQLETDTFDYIVMSDLVGYLDDVESFFQSLNRFCDRDTRLVVSYYNFLWQPALWLGERLGLKMPTPEQSWLSPQDLENLLHLAGYETVKVERRLLFPKYVPLLSWFLNLIGTLPGINRACLAHYVVARPAAHEHAEPLSTTIVIPCRDERDNIEPAIQRLPEFGGHQEIVFVDGHSGDGTPDEIRRVIRDYPDRDIKLLVQDGKGKGDAVRKGFADAKGDILMILDADLTVPPEDLPKFYDALASDKGEFINGSRLVYPLEGEAMRSLNLLGNKFFAQAFSWLLGQRFKDTLCGTKVIRRRHYQQLVQNRPYFGDFDPFGDFDLLFGASKLNLKIVEVPIRYRRRTYGDTKISRFRHGLLLLRMVIFGFRKIKAV